MNNPHRVALIIGHRGQDGTLLRQRLEADGIRVVGIGRPRPRTNADREPIGIDSAAEARRLVAWARPTEIYYLAAHHGSSETMPGESGDIGKSWQTHVAGFETLLSAIEASGSRAKILFASSCLVYEPSDHLIDESAPLRPDSVYGITKAAAMLLSRERRDRGLPVFTAVLFPHESGLRPESFIASKIVRAGLRIAAGSPERIAIAQPNAVADWSMADDVVNSMVELMQKGTPDDYIFASGRPTTVQELIELTSRHLRVSLTDRVDLRPEQLRRPHARRVGDPRRLMHATAWQPATDPDVFVQRLIESHRSHAKPS